MSDAASQTYLFEPASGEELTPLERKGEYTGERFLKLHPEKAEAILCMLAAGASVRRVTEKLQIHHRVVAVVRDSFPGRIAEYAKALGERSLLLSGDILAMIQEDAPFIKITNAKDLQHATVSMAKAAEVGQLLTGGATARVESVEKAKANEMGDFAETLVELEGGKDA